MATIKFIVYISRVSDCFCILICENVTIFNISQ